LTPSSTSQPTEWRTVPADQPTGREGKQGPSSGNLAFPAYLLVCRSAQTQVKLLPP